MRNWPGNLTYLATGVHRPETIAQVQELVAASDKIKAVGSRHSFSAVADSPGAQISLERLNGVVALDRERGTVTIEARTVPLLGIQLDPGKYEDARCPVFPDSVLQ